MLSGDAATRVEFAAATMRLSIRFLARVHNI
jgi:hypothetical protein